MGDDYYLAGELDPEEIVFAMMLDDTLDTDEVTEAIARAGTTRAVLSGELMRRRHELLRPVRAELDEYRRLHARQRAIADDTPIQPRNPLLADPVRRWVRAAGKAVETLGLWLTDVFFFRLPDGGRPVVRRAIGVASAALLVAVCWGPLLLWSPAWWAFLPMLLVIVAAVVMVWDKRVKESDHAWVLANPDYEPVRAEMTELRERATTKAAQESILPAVREILAGMRPAS